MDEDLIAVLANEPDNATEYQRRVVQLKRVASGVAAVILGVPGAVIGLNILISDDLRYWPEATPQWAAQFIGGAFVTISALVVWYALRRSVKPINWK